MGGHRLWCRAAPLRQEVWNQVRSSSAHTAWDYFSFPDGRAAWEALQLEIRYLTPQGTNDTRLTEELLDTCRANPSSG